MLKIGGHDPLVTHMLAVTYVLVSTKSKQNHVFLKVEII